MKIGAIGSYHKSVNFGRSLHKDEMALAYKAAQDARTLMGAQDGNGVLLLPSERLPKPEESNFKEQLSKFFDAVKKLLGINSVEIAGKTDKTVEGSIETALKENGLKKFVRFTLTDNTDELAKAAEEVAKSADGIRVVADNTDITAQSIKIIEEAFKKVKGEKFDPSMIVYEHGGKAYDWGSSKISGIFDGKVIVGSSHYLNDNDGLWGSTSFFTDRMKAKQGSFIHGLRNAADGSLEAQMGDENQIKAAQRLLETELKLQDDEILNPARFAAAKRADVVLSKHFYKHFDDLFPGVSADVAGFEKAYQEALQSGIGDNYFDSLAKAMKALGLDEKSPEVYESVCRYRNALFASGAKTLEDLAQMSAQEIEATYKDTSNIVLQGIEAKKAALEAAKAEAERKAQEEAKKLKELKEFLKTQENIEAQAPQIRESMKPLDISYFDKFINYVRLHKIQFILAGAAIALAAVGGTMYSYGKEISKKSEDAKPKSDLF